MALTFVALSIVPFLLIELWFYLKTSRRLREEPKE
jgi:hypothetical protein